MIRRLTAIAGIAASLWIGLPAILAGQAGAQPAKADGCVEFDAWYYTAGGTKNYVTPWPPGSCVGPSIPGWTPLTDPHASDDEEWLPASVKGVGFTSIIPSP